MLEDIRRLLSANGALIIAVPNAGGLQARIFGPQWFHLDVPRHLYHFTRSVTTRIVEVFTTQDLRIYCWGGGFCGGLAGLPGCWPGVWPNDGANPVPDCMPGCPAPRLSFEGSQINSKSR